MELEATVQVVTGAGSGLGRHTAFAMAREGARVVCIDVNANSAHKTARQVRNEGHHAIARQVDVTEADSLQAVTEDALDVYGRIDGLFANAGLPGAGGVLDVPLTVWDRTVAVNLTGAMLSARAVLPTMTQAGTGSILFTASISGKKAFPNQAAYAATKGGVIALAQQMALDFAPHGVRVNSLCPGMVVTPLVENLYQRRAEVTGVPKEKALADMAARYPLGRTGVPEDIAKMAVYLQSHKASWITGQSYVVDGGLTA